jgi:hypothetical protein
MPKTGSTSIQNALASAETSGGLGSVRYPLLGIEHGINHRYQLAMH